MTRPSALRVDISQDGSAARLRPATTLGEDMWRDFLSATAGARYDRERRCRMATLDKIPGILVRLRDAGFDAALQPTLRSTLSKTTAQQWQDYQSAKDRLAAIDKEIYERHGERLFPYQYTGAVWLTLRQGGAALFDEQGVGKTRSILVSLPPNAPVLVVCPASVKSVWYGETEKIRPHLRPKVLEGRASFRWPEAGRMLIANFEILPDVHDREGVKGRKCNGYLEPEPCPGCRDELVDFRVTKTGHLPKCNGFLEPFPCPGCGPILDSIPPGCVFVVDEAQAVKNSRAQRSGQVRAIGKGCRDKGGKSLVMTGTPLENDPGELWSVLQAAGLAQEAFGDWNTFVELFKGRKTEHNGQSYGYSWEDSPDDEVVERLRRVSLRRTKADVQKDLPPKLYGERLVAIDRKALETCDAFLREHGGVDGIERLLATEVKFETMSMILSALAAAKVPALLKIVEEEFETKGEPVLVFAMHRMPVELLGKKKGWETILGGTADRGDVVSRFQNGKLRGLAATIQAAGTGLTLHRADTAIFLSRSFNPMQNIQAEDRLHRIGQKRTVHIMSLVADHPLDRRIAEITAKKIRMFNASVGASSVVENEEREAGKSSADREFEAYLRRVEDEVKGRPLPRQFAATSEEKRVLEGLERARFPRRSDEKLAAELAEEANAVGLSEPRWRLALRVIERADPEQWTKTEVDSFIAKGVVPGPIGDQLELDERGDDNAEVCDRRGQPGRAFSEARLPDEVGKRSGNNRTERDESSSGRIDVHDELRLEGQDLAEPKAGRSPVPSRDRGRRGPARVNEDGLVVVDSDPHLADCERVTVDGSSPCTCGSVGEREDDMNDIRKKRIDLAMVDLMKLGAKDRGEIVLRLFDKFDDGMREELFEDLTDEYHDLCGQRWPVKGEHKCPYPDEDDEDEDDDEDDESEDETEEPKPEDRPS